MKSGTKGELRRKRKRGENMRSEQRRYFESCEKK
jgi:hypothetical protein